MDQTVILCYELSDQEAHTLHQVKAHVRAFAASKAFQSGVSLEQILSACHWKSHNTCDVLPSGGLFLLFMGLNSSLSSPNSEQVCKKGGGTVGLDRITGLHN